MNSIDTITETESGVWTETAADREPLFQAESAWRGRPNASARPHRVRRKRQQANQLSSRRSVRRHAAAAAPGGFVSDETLLAGPDLAEELHQQTWLSVLDHVGRFQSGEGNTSPGNGGGFKAWLFRIATNKANDVWRSRGRERNAKEGLRRILDRHAPEAGVGVETVEQNGRLAAALNLLPREQREALVLRFYSSMKFTEIAKVVGCPVNTALTRVHKGILKLRQMMEAE